MKATINVNGAEQEVISFVPQFEGKLAIVDYGVLQRLIGYLPSASFTTIKRRVLDDIDMCHNLDELIMVLQNELAFQTSVNRIKTYDPEDEPTAPDAGNTDLDKL